METICSACSTLKYTVGNSHGFAAAARSDCFAISKESQLIDLRPLLGTTKYNIFMRHWVRRRRV
jgi:hypothetical protein